jgi:hypothetical protein
MGLGDAKVVVPTKARKFVNLEVRLWADRLLKYYGAFPASQFNMDRNARRGRSPCLAFCN